MAIVFSGMSSYANNGSRIGLIMALKGLEIMTDRLNACSPSLWRLKGIGVLRIVFGLLWGIDAWFKWQPEFINRFANYLTGTLEGQSHAVQAWINFWINFINVDPHNFAHFVAVAESGVAIGLILGVFSNLTNASGVLLTLAIWSTTKSFGRPYVPGSADIVTTFILVVVFVGLFLANTGLVLGLDRWLTPLLGRWGFIASGSFHTVKSILRTKNQSKATYNFHLD